MKTLFSLFTAFTLMINMISCKKNQNGSENYQAKIDDNIKNLHQQLQNELEYDIPSLSVYIVSPKGTYFSTVTGKNGTPVTPDTYFRFASNTKNFTATAILNMMQDGWLNLDDLITANIPGTSVPYTPNTTEWDFPHKNVITIKQLLQHNAGVYDITNDASQYNVNGMTWEEYMLDVSPNHQFNTTQYVSLLTTHNLTYGLPNTLYHYSNTGYSILGEIIGRIYSQKAGNQKTYGDYIKEFISGPKTKVSSSMKFSELATDQQLPNPYIKGFILEDTGFEITDKKNSSGKVAEGNGIGTMKELSQYIRTLMKGENVLNSQTVELMKNSKGLATTEKDNNYALGSFHLEEVGYGHNGATEGYLSLMMHNPVTDITTIVVLPFWDLRNSAINFPKCINALNQTASTTIKILGY